MFAEPKTKDVAERVIAREKSPLSKTVTELVSPGAEYVLERCEVAEAQREVISRLPAEAVATIPRLVHSPTTANALLQLGAALWDGSEFAGKDG